ncbi:hypothetical protein [Halobaculum marinum]|uniref:Uncharacterized protein n=1 Tax=Halobaculum marinum TaxID=3031996 RepID=A0ABD5WYK1_9EURY|nr:hypothetical protein [Halobaculum sp. DT55]
MAHPDGRDGHADSTDRRRDALLAVAAGLGLLWGATVLGVPLARLLAPDAVVAAVAGVAGAVALELAMAARPDASRRLWADRRIRWGGTLLVAVGGAAAALAGGPGVGALAVATLVGGLVGYFLLLAGVVSGVLPEPATWFTDRED